jgi:hypothetical protein
MSSRAVQDDDISSQDHFSLSSSLQHSSHQDLDQWTFSTSDSMESSPIASAQPETPEMQMLSYSFSHQLLPGLTESAGLFPALSDLQAAHGLGEHTDLDMSHGQDFHFSSMVDFTAFDNDADGSMHDDASSMGHNDGHLFAAHDMWKPLSLDTGNFSRPTFDQVPGLAGPMSPPLTDESHVSVTSTCSQSTYSFQGQDDTLMGENNANSTVGGQNVSLGDPFFPLTPPLSEQDPNRLFSLQVSLEAHREQPLTSYRTIRPSKQAQRPLLSAAPCRSARKSDPEVYTSLSVRETLRQRSKDSAEVRAPRDHPYYSLPTQNDGKYYCPFATGENPCNHPPTTQKCAYQ